MSIAALVPRALGLPCSTEPALSKMSAHLGATSLSLGQGKDLATQLRQHSPPTQAPSPSAQLKAPIRIPRDGAFAGSNILDMKEPVPRF